ncbi:hypothetical protein E6C76_10910 [Pseudothauera nasutitermitis]|uniref:Uncharacterized protein n=1 Tax=Pseudothauera nasutitermitis TaxID=2565930 RepID=A0A4S4AWX2_9RHOO|nr:hypothetical protein [Pseudothauera nasutitermitis]THF64567.1 hypothetical protein E6C76_10910 [Pseudothauera nasutitermitis]
MKTRRLPAMLLCLSCLLPGHLQAREPQIELPRSARAFSVGDGIVLNGLPVSMRGFSSTQSIDELTAWFRRSLGAPVVENRLGGMIVLGRAVDGHYLTVMLQEGRRGVRGVTAVGSLRDAEQLHAGYRARAERLLSVLPHGSRLISDMVSEDRGRHAWHLVIDNTHGEQLNSERVTALMQQHGLALEHEARTEDDARLLYFRGGGAEAMAAVASGADRRGVIVINLISSSLEPFQ